MPKYEITKSDFEYINWHAIQKHVHLKREFIEAEVSCFISALPGWKAEIDSEWIIKEDNKAIICQFWIDYRFRTKRPIVENPQRAGYMIASERQLLFDLFNKIKYQPWINLKAVWIKEESFDGLVTVHFKVFDYESFMSDI